MSAQEIFDEFFPDTCFVVFALKDRSNQPVVSLIWAELVTIVGEKTNA